MMQTTRTLIEDTDCEGARLQLWEHVVQGKREHELVMNGVFLMASYNRESSEALIHAAMKRLGDRGGVRVLIGGLGMGFTASEACREPSIARIDIVELSPTILAWNRQYFEEHNQHCLDEERVRVIVDDFHDYVSQTKDTYDAILMDIDNGPALLVREPNRRVYTSGFFERVRNALTPGGVFVVWSCSEEDLLEQAGRQVFPGCDVETIVENRDGRDCRYFLYVLHNCT